MICGEFPRLETGTCTFIGDHLPTASGGAMEHRTTESTGAAPSPAQRAFPAGVAGQPAVTSNTARIARRATGVATNQPVT